MVETELRNLRLKASFINESHLFLTSPTSPTNITFNMEQACFNDRASRFHKKSNQTKTLSIGVDQGIQCSVHRLRTIRCQGKQLHPIGYPQPWWISAVRKNSSILSMVDKGASKPQPSSWPFHPTAVALFLLNEIVRFLALNSKVLTKQGHGEIKKCGGEAAELIPFHSCSIVGVMSPFPSESNTQCCYEQRQCPIHCKTVLCFNHTVWLPHFKPSCRPSRKQLKVPVQR